MSKKSDPWQAGIKIFSKLFGFDLQDDSQINQPTKGANGLISHNNSNPQMLGNQKSQQKKYQLKEKWLKLMKFPSKAKHRQVIELLREGSVIEEETWVWMLKNSQKISPQLYTQRKEQFNQIAYPKNPRVQQFYRFPQSVTEIQDFEQEQLGFDSKKLTRNERKRKFSITKNGLFLKQGSNMNGRASMNSQCSTFSSQTHKSNEGVQPQNLHESSFGDTLLCSKPQRIQSAQTVMKSSFISSDSIPFLPLSIQENNAQSMSFISQEQNPFPESQIHLLPQKIIHPVLASIIGAFLVHREDFSYSITMFNMTATFFYYTNSSQIKTFSLLNHVACSQFFVHYLSKNSEQTARIVVWIADKIRRIPGLSQPLRNFRLQNFIQNWLYAFFYSICENGSEVKEKIMGYLLINNFTIDSISKVCQSLILSLSKIISQRLEDRIYDCLHNPKLYIDKKVLFDHLLRYQD